MSILLSDNDLNKLKQATTDVLHGLITDIAATLVPAITGGLGGINATIIVTIPPIQIAPIKIEIGAKDEA